MQGALQTCTDTRATAGGSGPSRGANPSSWPDRHTEPGCLGQPESRERWMLGAISGRSSRGQSERGPVDRPPPRGPVPAPLHGGHLTWGALSLSPGKGSRDRAVGPEKTGKEPAWAPDATHATVASGAGSVPQLHTLSFSSQPHTRSMPHRVQGMLLPQVLSTNLFFPESINILLGPVQGWELQPGWTWGWPEGCRAEATG